MNNEEIHLSSNAWFANNKDLYSKIVYIILIMDVYGNCYIWSWSSTKCQRVTRSVLAAELYALAHGYDAGFNFAYAPENILKRIWKSNYWQIRKRYYLLWREKLLVDIFGIRDTYRNSEISNIGYIDSKYIYYCGWIDENL